MVGKWLALLSQSKNVLGSKLSWAGPFCVEFEHLLPSLQLPPTDMQVRLTGDSKLLVGLNVNVNGCLSLYVSHVMNWQLVQGVVRPHPMSAGIGSCLPVTLQRIRGYG